MRVLIVEDDQFKRERLEKFIRDFYHPSLLEKATSVTAAARAIEGENYEFIILDMSLPTYGVGREEPQGFGGRNLMRFLDGLGSQVPVIIVTQLESFQEGSEEMGIEELTRQLARDFPIQFHGLVYYDRKVDSWQEKLKTLVDAICAKESLNN